MEFVVNLNKQLHIPTLKELPQIPVEDFEKIAERSANNVLSNDNAKDIHKEDYLNILKKAYEGQ